MSGNRRRKQSIAWEAFGCVSAILIFLVLLGIAIAFGGSYVYSPNVNVYVKPSQPTAIDSRSYSTVYCYNAATGAMTFDVNNYEMVESYGWIPSRVTTTIMSNQTAFVGVDLHAQHWCQPQLISDQWQYQELNATVSALRDNGVLIIFAPSGASVQYASDNAYTWPRQVYTQPENITYTNSTITYPGDPFPKVCPDPDAFFNETFFEQSGIVTVHRNETDIILDPDEDQLLFYRILKTRGIKNLVYAGQSVNDGFISHPIGIVEAMRMGFNVYVMMDMTTVLYPPGLFNTVSESSVTYANYLNRPNTASNWPGVRGVNSEVFTPDSHGICSTSRSGGKLFLDVNLQWGRQ